MSIGKPPPAADRRPIPPGKHYARFRPTFRYDYRDSVEACWCISAPPLQFLTPNRYCVLPPLRGPTAHRKGRTPVPWRWRDLPSRSRKLSALCASSYSARCQTFGAEQLRARACSSNARRPDARLQSQQRLLDSAEGLLFPRACGGLPAGYGRYRSPARGRQISELLKKELIRQYGDPNQLRPQSRKPQGRELLAPTISPIFCASNNPHDARSRHCVSYKMRD